MAQRHWGEEGQAHRARPHDVEFVDWETGAPVGTMTQCRSCGQVLNPDESSVTGWVHAPWDLVGTVEREFGDAASIGARHLAALVDLRGS